MISLMEEAPTSAANRLLLLLRFMLVDLEEYQ
jgi:hypothetical protein